MIKAFFQKLKVKNLIIKLQQLSASAIAVNMQIQKSKLPDDVKECSKKIVELYVGYLMITNAKNKD